MKHRPFILVALATMPFTIAGGQAAPPTPPVKPDPVVALPARPAAPAPIATPEGVRYIPRDLISPMDREDIRRAAEDAKWAAQEAVRSIDFAKISDDASWAARDAMRGLDMARISLDAQRSIQNIDVAHLAEQSHLLSLDAMHNLAPLPHGNSSLFNAPRQSGSYKWVQGDPADSVYQLGWESFNRQDYSRAATRFAEVLAKYPNSRRASQAAYYEAFSRYRIGTAESLRLGLKVLETNSGKLAYDSRANEATVLQARILRALIQRNEPDAEAKLKALYDKYPAATCDSENNAIRSQVLNSLYQSDPESATPYISAYLATRDACSAELRRAALFLLADRPTEQKTAMIVAVAKGDTVRSVRERAIDLLSKMPGDAGIAALQELMRDNDERVQRAAVRSLMRSNNVKARSAIRASLLDKRDASESQRIEAIQSYDRDNTTSDDAAYLRNLFNRNDESDKIKEAVISVLARVPSEENVAFLLTIAKNSNESSQLRSRALRSVSRTTLTVDDLSKLYDANDSRSMRQSLVQALGERKEETAVTKLLEIVKFSTDLEVRRFTIQLLLNKNDQAITKKVLDLIKP